MNKEKRQKIKEKYNGLCAYTGKPLDENWQVDHIESKKKKRREIFQKCNPENWQEELKKIDNIENLIPACWIVNHYKRALDLDGFREYMLGFHKRLAKLPKNPRVEKSIKRKRYMYRIAELFEITRDKPFGGTFYFERRKK